jgi:gliding motility-associated-like protein
MLYRQIALSLFVILCSLQFSFAGHIIGSDMTYRCLGNGDYEITLKIYRDCFCTQCADFDPQAVISIYACGGAIDCNNLIRTNNLVTFNVPLAQRTNVPSPFYECQSTPTNLCVEEGLYSFRLSSFNIRLNSTFENYYIVYQRCCRNETINNILEPRSAGATYFVEITPSAFDACNSSPEFKEFPPTVICSNVPLDFDHSAVDPDGDSLSYRFCSPLVGGGLRGSIFLAGSATDCDGVAPNPACPPPFGTVNFRFPYSENEPMLGNPVIRIDPVSGLITGTPESLGQFVVGVCVDEWRNGAIIGTTRRDFQFNTAGCDPTVIADIEADLVNGQRYFVKSCGSNTVEFQNTSTQIRFIREYAWTFPEGNPRTSNQRNAVITFPDTGRYVGKLVLNPGLQCSDSLDIVLDVFPEINADFEFSYDTCTPGPIAFRDLSFSGSGDLTRWDWRIAPQVRLAARNPTHQYQNPGIYPVELIVEDKNGCRDSIIRDITYFPVPETVIVAPDQAIVCLPGQSSFFNLSEPINESYTVIWDFGDGNTGSGLNVTHEYLEPGKYTVSVTITSPIGCTNSAVFNELVVTLPSPIAGFDFNPKTLTNFQRTTRFTDQSIDAATWEWIFDMFGRSSLSNPEFTFPDTGRYQITQIVTHENGCTDTIIKWIDVVPTVTWFMPNAFTPDGDGLNDIFKGTGVLKGATNFSMQIFNRWGELLFETQNPESGWNGSKMNSGAQVQPGVYVYVVKYNEPRGTPVELKGFATLVR